MYIEDERKIVMISDYNESIDRMKKYIARLSIEEKEKLKMAREILRNLEEQKHEEENYYKKNYWRNEDLTMNSRKSRKQFFSFYGSMDSASNKIDACTEVKNSKCFACEYGRLVDSDKVYCSRECVKGRWA